MALSYSKKVILISKDAVFPKMLKSVLTKQQIDIASDYLNLHSMDIIKKGIARSGNTTFLRTELLRFIKENGYPFLIALDYKLISGLPEDLDPDQMKILRTFIISFIILSRGKGFEGLKGNFLIFGTAEQTNEIERLDANPHHILALLATKDKVVNSFIEELKASHQNFNKLFFIKCLHAGTHSNEMTTELTNYVTAIKARQNLTKPEKKGATINKGDYEAAKIVYRLDEEQIFIDGTLGKIEGDEFQNLEQQNLYIVGHWANKTLVDVSDKLTATILKGLGEEKTFTPEDEITINMTERCIVDSTTTGSLAQVLSKELAEYGNINIAISPDNYEILSQAKGFSLIKKALQQVEEAP